MIKYMVFKEEITVEDRSQTVYGIEAFEKVGDVLRSVERVSDITYSREKAEQLCDKCNKNKLSPLHLKDVCEDFLCRMYG